MSEDGSTTAWMAPEQPDGVARGNRIQTDPETGWFILPRLYSPRPASFDESRKPSAVGPVG